ncbi:MAG: glycosyltransferase family 1 protein, partial [Acidobacteria bacterium]
GVTRIAIDARELAGRPTGVGRYLGRLLQSWGGLGETANHRFILYLPAGTNVALPTLPPGSGRLDLEVSEVPGKGGTRWEQGTLARAVRRDSPDVLFCPAYTAPLLVNVPVVLTIHDVSFLAHPEWFPGRTRLRRRLVTSLAARRASAILTVSAFSKDEIVGRLRVAPDRVRIIPHAPTNPPAPLPPPPRAPLILFVGSLFNRRHLPELIHATATVVSRHPDVRLTIVGEDRTYPALDLASCAERAGVGRAVSFRSYLQDADLGELYARASAFAFLSDYEGFGLTPLEAMAAGVPAVVGDTPVAHEVYGGAACFVPTGDVDRIAAALESALFDAGTRARLEAAAKVTLARYSWDRAGRETLSALVEAGRSR